MLKHKVVTPLVFFFWSLPIAAVGFVLCLLIVGIPIAAILFLIAGYPLYRLELAE